jgi:hypothetical protein
MTDNDTPRYATELIEVIVRIELDNMPAVPTSFGSTDIIVSSAVVLFNLIDGDFPNFRRIKLTGSIPLKSGGPSKRSQSDDYSSWNADRMPDPIRDIVVYAQAQVMERLK